MKSIRFLAPWIAPLAILLSGCSSDDTAAVAVCPLADGKTSNSIDASVAVANPFGTAPLTALLTVSTEEPGQVTATVLGRNGVASNIERKSISCSVTADLPIYGLYPGTTNQVKIDIINDGVATVSETLTIETPPLPDNMPGFRIETDYADDTAAFFLVNFRPTNLPLMVDRFGEIRWFLNVPGVKYGLQRLANGNIAFGLAAESRIEEFSPFGEQLNVWSVEPGFTNIHHDVYEQDDGNFLVTANKVGIDTVEDFVVEVDRDSGQIVKEWDMRPILPRRYTLIEDEEDWFHINAVIRDERDDSLIISGQRSALVKVTQDNELRWILAPQLGWEGFEDFLLTAEGSAEHEWNWGQHAPEVLPNGELLLFDNGFGRGYGAGADYSRAVTYRIDEDVNGGGVTQQTWQFGKERGSEFHSPVISDVDYLADDDHVLITSGSLGFDLNYISPSDFGIDFIEQPEKASIVEVDFDGNVIFEMIVTSTLSRGSVYRTEKFDHLVQPDEQQ